MKTLSREDILNATDRKIEEVLVPEWGGKVLLRHWSGADQDAFEKSLETTKSDSKLRAVIAAMSICDENGGKLFEPKDIETLGEKSKKALDRVMQKVFEMNGATPEAESELLKN